MATPKPTTYFVDSKGDFVIDRDTDAQLDYSFDWTAWLALNPGDAISAVEFIVDPTLTVVNQSHDASTATVWLTGGTKPDEGPNKLRVTCRITTTNTPPRIDDRSIFLRIVER